MNGTKHTPHAAPVALMPWPPTHYGCRVVELGEDSEDYAVAGPQGHVPERRAKAAVMHYLRIDCSYSLDGDVYGWDRDYLADIARGTVTDWWVVATDDDDEPWMWCDEEHPNGQAVTLVSPL